MRRDDRRRGWRVEGLEVRSLMATFQMPTLEGLANGRNTAATFERMVGSLQAQIAIQAPKDTPPRTMAAVVDEMVDLYEEASRSAFAGAPRTLELLVQQGEALRRGVEALGNQYELDLITLPTFFNDAYLEVQELTLSRDVWPAGTPLQTFLVMATETSEDLTALATAMPSMAYITDERAALILKAEVLAFQAETNLGATRLPRVAEPVDRATATFLAAVDAAIGEPDFDARVATAAAGFASALVGPGGTFGPGGSLGRRIAQPPRVETPLPIEDAATFSNLQYTQVVTTSTLVLHRNFSSASNRYGRFMSTDVFRSPAQAVRKLALDQSWYGTNQAWYVQDVTLPAGTLVYVGRVAPIYQGIFRREAAPGLYPGMAVQYLVANTRAPGITWDHFRATGT